MAFADPLNVIGIGTLTRDPEIKYLPSGDPIINFSIARNRGKTKDGQEKDAHFFNLVAFKGIAETIAKFCLKGSHIYFEGELIQDTWEDADGAKRERVKIIVNFVKFLNFKRKKKDAESGPEQEGSSNFTDDDLPF